MLIINQTSEEAKLNMVYLIFTSIQSWEEADCHHTGIVSLEQ